MLEAKSGSESPASPGSITSATNSLPSRSGSLVVRSTPAMQHPQLSLNAFPPLSVSADALPPPPDAALDANLRKPTLFLRPSLPDPSVAPLPPPISSSTPPAPVALAPPPPSVSPRLNPELELRIWKVYFEECGVNPEEAAIDAELLLKAGISCNKIGSLTQATLMGAGLKIGHALRFLKRQREEQHYVHQQQVRYHMQLQQQQLAAAAAASQDSTMPP